MPFWPENTQTINWVDMHFEFSRVVYCSAGWELTVCGTLDVVTWWKNVAMSYGELGRVFSSRLAWPGIRKIILVAGVKDALGLGWGTQVERTPSLACHILSWSDPTFPSLVNVPISPFRRSLLPTCGLLGQFNWMSSMDNYVLFPIREWNNWGKIFCLTVPQ